MQINDGHAMILLGNVKGRAPLEHAQPVMDLRWIDYQKNAQPVLDAQLSVSRSSFTAAQKITESLQTRGSCSVRASLWDGLEPCLVILSSTSVAAWQCR